MPENPAYVRACSLTYTQEARIREIIREELASYLRTPQTVTHGDGTMPYREYLATRDEPPAAPIPDLLP